MQLLDIAENSFIGCIPRGLANLSSMIISSKVHPKVEIIVPDLVAD
jgi:hypothetical protein